MNPGPASPLTRAGTSLAPQLSCRSLARGLARCLLGALCLLLGAAPLPAATTGTLTVTLNPPWAQNEGARWRLAPRETSPTSTIWHCSDQTVIYPPGDYTLVFREPPAWRAPAPQRVRITAGGNASASGRYARRSGKLVAWHYSRPLPSPDSGFVAVAMGWSHSLGLRDDGRVEAWGDNSLWQCILPVPNADFVAIAAGYYHNLALKSDGSIVAWGNNSYYQCKIPKPNSDFVAVAAGGYGSLGLKADGSIVAWGTFTAPLANTDFVAIAGGGHAYYGIKADGSLYLNGTANFGLGTLPVANTGFLAVSGSAYFALVLKANGSVVAWGNNKRGQLNVPAPNSGFIAVAASIGDEEPFSLGIKSDGSLVGWGSRAVLEHIVPEPGDRFIALAAGNRSALGIVADPGNGEFLENSAENWAQYQ